MVRSATRLQPGIFRRDCHCHALRYATSSPQGAGALPPSLWRVPVGTAAQVNLLAPHAPPGSAPLHPGVWRITAEEEEAAVAATGTWDFTWRPQEHGHGTMHALQWEHLGDQDKSQAGFTTFFPSGSGDTFRSASGKAAAESWIYLQQGFAKLNQQTDPHDVDGHRIGSPLPRCCSHVPQPSPPDFISLTMGMTYE